MAVDDSIKRRHLADTVIRTVTQLITDLDALYDLDAQYTDTGIAWVDADFTGQATFEHIDAATIVAVITSVRAIKAFMATGHNTNMKKVIR